MSTRFVVKLARALAPDEPVVDWAPSADTLVRVIADGSYDPGGDLEGVNTGIGSDYDGSTGCVCIDLEDAWHRAQSVEIPDDPHELAITICAIAASTPDLQENYAAVMRCLALDLGEMTASARCYLAWADATNAGHGEETADAEAHAALVCKARP